MIGRTEEKKYLQSLLKKNESQFVAVFGRRRIGKTYLVRESFDYHFTFQHTGISSSEIKGSKKKAQLERFEKSLAEAGYVSAGKITSWDEAFDGLKEVIRNSTETKKVIFIDELSWMDTKQSGLITALESFWNGWATARKEKDVILIVCASATYWMIDKIVNAKGGLHNRLTGRIYLKPFTLKECEEYLLSENIRLTRHQILQAYMILGGVPYYWTFMEKGKSLPQNIDHMFFEENAVLEGEYENLYRSLFDSPEQYIKIIEALSKVKEGVTREDIAKAAKIPKSGNLSKKLRELENCGFIRKYVPFGYKEKNTIYQLIDNYTLFYHQFLKNNPSDEKFWENQFDAGKIHSWSGLAFEKVCLEHIPQIKAALGITGVSTEVNAWRCSKDTEKGLKGSQIDLLIVRRDQVINVCEMKFCEDDFEADAAFDRALRRKVRDFMKATKTKSAIHPILITTYGVGDSPYMGNVQAVITAEDLFRI